MSEKTAIRALDFADISAVAAIYAHHVLTGTASFEILPPDEDEMRRRACAVRDWGFPWYVAEAEGAVAGFAYAAPYRPRPAYARTMESSVYVAPEYARKGIGRALMEAVIASVRALGGHRLIAVIGGSDNEPSIALHEALGFRRAGVFTQAGFKFGRYVDTVLYELALDQMSDDGSQGSEVR